MKDKKNYLILFAGIVLGVSIVGIVICFTIGRINLVDKTYSTKSNSYNIKEDIKEIEQDETISKEIQSINNGEILWYGV